MSSQATPAVEDPLQPPRMTEAEVRALMEFLEAEWDEFRGQMDAEMLRLRELAEQLKTENPQ